MTVAIIQARSSSKRFPNKVMQQINGYPLISYVYNRVKKSNKIKKIFVASSVSNSDDKLVKYCKIKDYKVFRGSLNNVIKRFSQILKKKNIKYFVRINGDSPCIDPKVIDKAVNLFKKKKYDIVTNVFPRSYPKGISVEVIKSKLIIDLDRKKINKHYREHITSFFYNNSHNYNIKNFKNKKNYSRLSLAVDTKNDLLKMKSVLENKNFLNYDWKKILLKLKK